MLYLVNSVNFIKYLNYFYKLNLKYTLKHKLEGYKWGIRGWLYSGFVSQLQADRNSSLFPLSKRNKTLNF